MAASTDRRLELIELERGRAQSDFGDAVRRGLGSTPKTLPCRFFYDAEGSKIFEEICELPEYYLTRAEHEILAARSGVLARLFPASPTVIELGSGSATKTRVLIESFLNEHGRVRYVPVDISSSMLEHSARTLLEDYDGLEVRAIAAEYRSGLAKAQDFDTRRKLVIWLGSSIGNFERPAAAAFLGDIARVLSDDDILLVGFDLRKDRNVLLAAYDDAAGVTARFNKNILARINRELDGQFSLDTFRHEARWCEHEGRIEMHLVSEATQDVRIDGIDFVAHFEAGESIHTESSHKYDFDDIHALAAETGMAVFERWTDSASRFAVILFRRA